MSHYEARLESDLGAIREHVWKIGQDVEIALSNARKVLARQDESLAYNTILGDNPINRDSRECDRLCHRFIARHLPGAGHLREMAATIRVNVALERIGDYAVTMCREALQSSGPFPDSFLSEIECQFDKSMEILNYSRKSFREGDDELAIAMMQEARNVEGRMDTIYQALFDQDDHMDAPTMLAIFVVFSLLKRIADQAKNICDQTVYAVSGIAKIAKTYKVMFLARPGTGLGHLAAAIGRKNFSSRVTFDCSIAGGTEPVPPTLRPFLAEAGLPDEELIDEHSSPPISRVDEYNLIVCLDSTTQNYLEKVPFHTSALSWDITASEGETFSDLYRELLRKISDLVDFLVGGEKQ